MARKRESSTKRRVRIAAGMGGGLTASYYLSRYASQYGTLPMFAGAAIGAYGGSALAQDAVNGVARLASPVGVSRGGAALAG